MRTDGRQLVAIGVLWLLSLVLFVLALIFLADRLGANSIDLPFTSSENPLISGIGIFFDLVLLIGWIPTIAIGVFGLLSRNNRNVRIKKLTVGLGAWALVAFILLMTIAPTFTLHRSEYRAAFFHWARDHSPANELELEKQARINGQIQLTISTAASAVICAAVLGAYLGGRGLLGRSAPSLTIQHSNPKI